MRRALLGLAAAAFALVAFAGPAGAAPGGGQVFHFTTVGNSAAGAFWSTGTATSHTDTFVQAGNSALLIGQITTNLDANGNFVGETDTFVQVTSGFSFALHQPLASASLRGSGLPATTCTYDADGNQIACSDTTLDVTVAWTGQGPIIRGARNVHQVDGGVNLNEHVITSSREASTTGTVAGQTFSGGPESGNLGTGVQVVVVSCIGGAPC